VWNDKDIDLLSCFINVILSNAILPLILLSTLKQNAASDDKSGIIF
jgi:hypothetical protein